MLRAALLVTLLAVAALTGNAKAPTATPTARQGMQEACIDQRVELVSILARLAEIREYCFSVAPGYEADIQEHFGPYKDHPAVLYLKALHKEAGIGYNAIPIMGVYLTEPPRIRPLLPITDQQPESRWGKKRGEKFIKLLQEFYKDAHCQEFFERHTDTYSLVEQTFRKTFRQLDEAWFSGFYGETPTGSFRPIIGMGFGPGNYGGSITYPDNTEDKFAFMGSWEMSPAGVPQFQAEGFLNTLVHEFNHSFVNPALDAEPKLKDPGQQIFEAQKEIMTRMAYGSASNVLNETFVRAAQIRYSKSHGATPKAIANQIQHEVVIGFIWMPEAVALLEAYGDDRKTYPTFKSFIPRIVDFCTETGTNIEAIRTRRAEEKADEDPSALHVVASEPFTNGDQEVDPATDRFTIRFDKPVVGRGYSFGYGPSGPDLFPELNNKIFRYSEDKQSVTIGINLKPGREYEFTVLKDFSFYTPDGTRMTEDYLIRFRTRAK